MPLRILLILIAITLVVFAAGFIRTWQIQLDAQQKVFLAGTLPNPAPDGLYHGTVTGHAVSWLGKKLNSADNTGINLFNDGAATPGERYPFKTYAGKGIRDTKLDVLKIDYNIPGNPFWLRAVLDEIVEVSPGVYLGKLHVRFAGFSAALAYFELKK